MSEILETREKSTEESNEFDVDLLRKSWEIEEHWILRRDFILTHFKKFPFDRLLCLAQTFVNIETLGNGYDPKLMQTINDLSKDVKSFQELLERKRQNV